MLGTLWIHTCKISLDFCYKTVQNTTIPKSNIKDWGVVLQVNPRFPEMIWDVDEGVPKTIRPMSGWTNLEVRSPPCGKTEGLRLDS